MQDPTQPAPLSDDAFSERLAEWHQSLTSGTPTASDDDARLQSTEAFLRQIEQLWPKPGTPESPLLPHRMGHIGRLQLRQVLGIGGFAIVYLAHDPVLDRLVAVKLPRPEVLLTPQAGERFAREARAIAQLRHPHILPIFDSGELASGHYLVTAYCSGGTLSDWLKRRTTPVPVRCAAALVARLADAVQHAHQQQILHRDLKPSNVLLEPASEPLDPDLEELGAQPRISDFGLSKIFAADGSQIKECEATLQTGSALLGTPLYMAPEQVRKDRAGVGPATDLYALGVILYELLIGKTPFHADDQVETLRRIVEEDPPPLRPQRPDVPPDLEAVCLRCLEKDPAKRHASAGELADDLRRFLKGEPTRTRPWSRWERISRWTKRRRGLVRGVAALVVAVGVAAAGIAWHNHETNRFTDALGKAGQREQDDTLKAAALRVTALKQELDNARLSYEAQMRSAADLFKDGQSGLVNESLHAIKWRIGDTDLRGFEWHWLKAASRSVIHLRTGKRRPLFAAAFYSDKGTERCLAVADDRNQYAWDPHSLALLEKSVVEPWVDRVDIPGDGQVLAFWTRQADKLVCELRTPAGKLLAATRFDDSLHSDDAPLIVATAPGGKHLAYNSDPPKLWDVAAKRWVPLKFRGGEGEVVAMNFSPDGRQLLLARNNSKPRGTVLDVHSVQSGNCDARRLMHIMPEEIVGCQAKSEIVAARDKDSRVVVYDNTIEDSSKRLLYELEPTPDLRRICLSPSGKLLLLGYGVKRGKAPLVSLYEAASGKLLESFDDVAAEDVTSAAFSADEKRVIIGCADGIARVWSPTCLDPSPRSHRTVWSHWPLPTTSIAFSASGFWASGGEGGVVHLRHLTDDKRDEILRPHGSLVSAVAFSPDGQWLASGGYDCKVIIRHLKSGSELICEGHTERIRTVAFSPQGALLASSGSDNVVRLWDVATAKAKATLAGHTDAIRQLAFDPVTGLLASAGNDRVVRLWDVAKEACVAQLPHTGQVWCVAFSHDGKWLVTGDQDGIMRVWDAKTHEVALTIRGHRLGILSAVFSPDGRTIASGDGAGSVRLWSAKSAQELLEFPKQAQAIAQLAFSSDGAVLAAAGRSGMISFWNTAAAPARAKD